LEYVFTLPMPSSVLIFIGILVAIFVIVAILLVVPIAKFSIKVTGNKIVASSPIMYKVTIDRNNVASIEIVDLKKEPGLKPRIRTFGIGLPGYKLGWFKLANGAKAFLAVTSNNNEAVVIKLLNGTYVILSPKNFTGFINTLKGLEWIGK